jgi:hypothetical protein
MGNYKVLTLSDWREWSNTIDSLNSDVYFSPEYHALFEQFGDGKACCFVYKDGLELYLRPYFINSINSLGYKLDKEYFDIQSVYGYTGPISSTADISFLTSAAQSFEEFCIGAGIVAGFTRFHPLLNNFQYSGHNPSFDRNTIAIDLKRGGKEIWTSQFTGNARNMVRKAGRLGYSAEIESSPSELQIQKFIELYSANMSKVTANDYFFFDKKFFFNSFKLLKGKILLFNILDSTQSCVASSMFLLSQRYLHYHLSGRSITADNSVNSLVIQTAVNFGIENNLDQIHLGGGRTTGVEDSLLKFKKSFSSNELSFWIEKKIYNQAIYEMVVQQWEERAPRSSALKNVLLKYRFK